MNKLLIAYIGALLLILICIFQCMFTITTGKLLNVIVGGFCLCLQFFYATEFIKWIYQEAFKQT